MAEVLPEEIVHSSSGLLRVAGHCLDVDLEVPLQELVHLPIVIIIISRGKNFKKNTQSLLPKGAPVPSPCYGRGK